jgi:hypothetical protein
MGKGYAEGPAAEEAEAARERGDHLARSGTVTTRRVVLGSTPDNPEQHLIGYADEVDADQLFASGQAWGLKVVNAVE